MTPNSLKKLFLSTAVAIALAGCGSSGGTADPASNEVSLVDAKIRVNQQGYPSKGLKRATIVSQSTESLTWQLMNDTRVLASGTTKVFGNDAASGEHIHQVDFSSVQQAGFHHLVINAGTPNEVSRNITIEDALYQDLYTDAAKFFYLHRMGEPIEAQYLSNPAYARKAIHPGDDSIACYQDWCGKDTRLNVKGTWYDAGDFGMYSVNFALTAWTLLNAYEFGAIDYKDGDLNIPESGNSMPDLLDEIRFGSTFMAGMLPPTGQLASHKVHNQNWSGFEGNIDLENAMERYAQPGSTAATYAVARNAAQLARVYASYDATYSAHQWQVAKDAWQRAETLPVTYYTSETPDSTGGGDYDDENVVDDRYAASAELWATAIALKSQEVATFEAATRESADFLNLDPSGSQQWQQVQGAGSLTLWLHREAVGLSEAEQATLQGNIVATAQLAQRQLSKSGYPMVYNPNAGEADEGWPWGSNSSFLNRLMVVSYAHNMTDNRAYLETVYQGMDYLMGNNPLNLSMITGYGDHYEVDLHDRIFYSLLRDQGVAFPKGWVAGGPLTGWKGCDNATPDSGPNAKRYAAFGTAPEAWCSKEVAINWNSPLVWVAAYLEGNPL
ncbi:glycoside hydrolase family 9 protein [Echinimonas agarilytica]|uniref:Glycoside hydrolase family 9 protein n=1 Tax=Echinimonas agarilytica TaxID=1215918 RepID=A0AA41W4P2_9GAMM|nr:glycoside hydrolase family 9 protein [Echinimonas agarilytica]MCM2678882.1 glycoside hydrolase family 9 protein [Echinimonas agarilytica]